MTLVLMAVGLMVAAVGLVAIGFGIPINAFSLGNTLIISGTVGLAGGMILVGLALVLGQLRRIVEALRDKPLARAESAESVAAPASRAAPSSILVQPPAEHQAVEPSRAPEPQAPEPPRAPEPRAPEPRFPATASGPAPGPLDWLRVKSKPVTTSAPSAPMPAVPMPEPPRAGESSLAEASDEALLSPRPLPQRPAGPPAIEAMEPRVWSPSREASREASRDATRETGRDVGPAEPRLAPRPEQPPPRANPPVEPPREKERFDLVWPDRGAAPVPAPAPSEPKLEPTKREPTLEMPLPPVPARPREARPAAERRIPELTRKVERGPAILKSGVIDGMPYTLYADGSIEAQLPQGMVKFASVDALRAHLEKQG